MTRTTHFLLAIALLLLGSSASRADLVPPPGVGPGETYHIAFATSFQTRLSTNRTVPPSFPDFGGIDAASWNTTFAAFNAGLFSGWNGSDLVYRAVLSDSTADAIDHTNIQGAVYNTNGDLLATDATDFFDGVLINPIGYDEFGNPISPSQDAMWSGTVVGGAASAFTCGNWDLTGIDPATIGASATNPSLFSGSSLQCVTDTARLLAISQPITVAVPEAGSFVAVGAVALLVATRRQGR